jgi:3-oxoacyl-[acyl-carrier protein] reductase
MDLGLKGKRALVLSSSRGLGRAIAEGLAAEGAHVALTARNREQLQALADSISAQGRGRATAIVGDLSVAAKEIFAEAHEALGGIDILVANTGGPIQRNGPTRGGNRAVGAAGNAGAQIRSHHHRRVDFHRAADS